MLNLVTIITSKVWLKTMILIFSHRHFYEVILIPIPPIKTGVMRAKSVEFVTRVYVDLVGRLAPLLLIRVLSSNKEDKTLTWQKLMHFLALLEAIVNTLT